MQLTNPKRRPFHGEGDLRATGSRRPALGHYINVIENRADAISSIDFARIPSLAISACGTAYLAGLIGKYWLERYARLPVESTWRPNYATARSRCRRSRRLFSFRSRAKPPIRWHR
ncbi:hypothetical protein [Mesorhizobium australicum]|uniref:hypothetical protein n=1 Tax=Mesorhizobium australicum TaxID=536018 RepID=UPI003EB918DD